MPTPPPPTPRLFRRSRALALCTAALLACTPAGCHTHPSPVHLREQGNTHASYGRTTRAIQAYRQVVEIVPGDWATRVKLSESLLQLGEPTADEEALSHLRYAYSVAPSDPGVLDRLAQALLRTERLDELHSFLTLLAQDAKATEGYLRLGRFAATAGDPDEAERALLTAATLDQGRSLEPQITLAAFYADLGDTQESLKRLRMALFIAPTDKDVHARIRELGHIPGPTFALRPAEATNP